MSIPTLITRPPSPIMQDKVLMKCITIKKTQPIKHKNHLKIPTPPFKNKACVCLSLSLCVNVYVCMSRNVPHPRANNVNGLLLLLLLFLLPLLPLPHPHTMQRKNTLRPLIVNARILQARGIMKRENNQRKRKKKTSKKQKASDASFRKGQQDQTDPNDLEKETKERSSKKEKQGTGPMQRPRRSVCLSNPINFFPQQRQPFTCSP